MLDSKIGKRLIFWVVLTVLVVIGIFAIFNIQSQRGSLLNEVERHASQLSEAVKSDTEYDMMRNDRERIHESIRRIGQQESIDRVRVFNKTGEIIYSSSEDEIGRMVDKKAESCFMCHSAGAPLEHLETGARTRIFRPEPDGARLLGIINPIYNSSTCANAACHAHPASQTVLGVLDVTIPLNHVDQDIRRSQWAVIILAVSVILILSLIVGLLVRKWIDRPIRELLAAMKDVAGGNLSSRLEESGEDEFGMLARSFNNMTEKLAQARMQLFQSDKLASLGRLAAGVAHEINNPLTAVLTYSSFLLKRSEDQPETRADLEVIVSETIRSREIVKSLLDFARQSVPKKREADINEVIRRSAIVIENQVALRQAKLEFDLDEQLPRVTVDANQMQQVFINLLVNALDAIGDDGGTVTVSSKSIQLSASGTLQIKQARCRKRHDLIDRMVTIDSKPAIGMLYRKGDQSGPIHLDPMYRSHNHRLRDMPPLEDGVDLVCPECSNSLLAEGKRCPKCDSPIYTFEVPMKGMVEGCLHEGCHWQRWKQVDNNWNDQFIEIKVADDGCGIPESQLEKLFEPFATTKGQKGTGLGLAVTWGIIDNHNGSITVDSKVGVGTTFTIRLPVSS